MGLWREEKWDFNFRVRYDGICGLCLAREDKSLSEQNIRILKIV